MQNRGRLRAGRESVAKSSEAELRQRDDHEKKPHHESQKKDRPPSSLLHFRSHPLAFSLCAWPAMVKARPKNSDSAEIAGRPSKGFFGNVVNA